MRYFSAIIAASLLFAAGQASADEPKVNPIEAGDGALMFSYGGLFTSTPSNLDDVGVGGRYYMSDTMAVRAALGIDFESGSIETQTPGNTSTTERANSNFGLEAGVELTTFQSPTVTIYWGGLAQLVFGSDDLGQGPSEQSTRKIGVMGLIGATYFFTEYVSVGAEYRVGLVIDTTEDTIDANTTVTNSTSNFGTGSAGFHLSFWF